MNFLRPLVIEDAEMITKQLSNPTVLEKLLLPNPYSIQDAISFLSTIAKKPIVRGICFGEVVGGIISITVSKSDPNVGILGYWLGQDYWGKGVMTQAVNQMVSMAFTELNIDKIIAEVFIDNIGSEKVLLKNKFQKLDYQNSIIRHGEPFPANVYMMTRLDYDRQHI